MHHMATDPLLVDGTVPGVLLRLSFGFRSARALPKQMAPALRPRVCTQKHEIQLTGWRMRARFRCEPGGGRVSGRPNPEWTTQTRQVARVKGRGR